MTILDALRDPDLFGRLPRFRDLSTWGAWLVFLKAMFGHAMTDAEADLFRRCTGRTEPPTVESDEAAGIIGRRGGKSQIASLIAVFLALLRDWRPYVASGEVVHVVVVSQNMRAGRVPLNYIKGILRAVPAFAREVAAERSDEVDLKCGVTLGVWPCTYRSTRGLTIAAAILDEVDFWWQESVNAAEEVVASIRPAMASLPGTKLVAISSPYTPVGWLHEFYKHNWGRDGGALIWNTDSVTMNPTLDEEKIAAAYRDDPERAAAEYGGRWRAGVAALFDPALVDAAVRREPLVLPPLGVAA